MTQGKDREISNYTKLEGGSQSYALGRALCPQGPLGPSFPLKRTLIHLLCLG